jgi:putative beta-lysine N-acetyltransferase
MGDALITFQGSLIQHGPENDRVYLMRMSLEPAPELVEFLEHLASRGGYSKIVARIPASAWELFRSHQYELEARVPGMYRGRVEGYLVSQFRDPDRRKEDRTELLTEIRKTALAQSRGEIPPLPPDCAIGRAGPEDAGELASLYKAIFPTYPFPIQDPAYLRHTMGVGIQYYAVRKNGSILAAASAEHDPSALCVELTDFATLPRYRGQGLSLILLAQMEKEMRSVGTKTAYTIARACSPAVNIIFSRAGYDYGGTLIQNTQICGDLESMNVWYKSLEP